AARNDSASESHWRCRSRVSTQLGFETRLGGRPNQGQQQEVDGPDCTEVERREYPGIELRKSEEEVRSTDNQDESPVFENRIALFPKQRDDHSGGLWKDHVSQYFTITHSKTSGRFPLALGDTFDACSNDLGHIRTLIQRKPHDPGLNCSGDSDWP